VPAWQAPAGRLARGGRRDEVSGTLPGRAGEPLL